MCHRPELAGLDAPHDLLGGVVEDVFCSLDEVTVGFLGAPGTSVSSSLNVEVAGFSTMT
jgi:hypothetical protein